MGVCIVLAGGGWWFWRKKASDGQSPPWYPTPLGGSITSPWDSAYSKAVDLVAKMTLPEKVNITTGVGWQMGLAVGNTGPATTVGFPSLSLQDGPLGIRFADNATAFPAGITVGATWNKTLMFERGEAHGTEARLKGVDVLLGPCVGPLGRMPAGGRNWEGFGSDPYLQGIAARETVKGIQTTGVMATIKHFIGNEQEHFRQAREWGTPQALSSNIGDRTLHELYLWPFADAVRAGVASVMCSYQMVNDSYACANSKLMNGILKDELGFQGFVQSDWLAQRSGVATALAGLDMSMPGDGLVWAGGESLWGPELTKSVLNGSVPLERLNDMVTRVVASWYRMDLNRTLPANASNIHPNFSSWTNDEKGHLHHGSSDDQENVVVNKYINVGDRSEYARNHSAIARQVAAEGTVLLKNIDSILPLRRAFFPTEEEIKGTKVKLAIFGEDAGAGRGPNACVDRGCNQGTLASGWGSGAVEFPYLITPVEALRRDLNMSAVEFNELSGESGVPGKSEKFKLEEQDVCLVFVNADAGEGYIASDGVRGDRNHLDLQKGGENLVLQIADGCGSANGGGQTIVVVHAVGPVILEKFIDHPNVAGVVWANLPGQESGNALVDILSGKVNPSGKLPYTIGKSLQDYGPGARIMYYPNSAVPQQDFNEGVYIDYRHFDKFSITPRYEFGFGLSYTSFEYSELKIAVKRAKSEFPAPRPAAPSKAAQDGLSKEIPDAKDSFWPADFGRRLSKYIYPYINPGEEKSHGSYSYPDGYDILQPPSQAGGGEGGNPSLWDVMAIVEVTIKNVGEVAGAEVAQLYLSYPNSSTMSEEDAMLGEGYDKDLQDFPVKVLRGFEKVMLEKGGEQRVSFELLRRDLSYWDTVAQNWRMPVDGRFKVRVGGSSRDLPLEAEL